MDALANNGPLLQQMRTTYAAYMLASKEWENLVQAQAAANKELDYNRFLFNELYDCLLYTSRCV